MDDFTRKAKKFIYFLAGGSVLFLLLSGIIYLSVDMQWFKDVNYYSVFVSRITKQAIVFVSATLFIFIVLNTYLRIMKKDYINFSGDTLKDDEISTANKLISGFAVVAGLNGGFFITKYFWIDIFKFVYSRDFGINDPIFSRDISFYVFQYPLLKNLFLTLAITAVTLAVTTSVFYTIIRLAKGSLTAQLGTAKEMNAVVIKQICNIVSVLFLMLALFFYNAKFGLLFSKKGVAYGAGYTDIAVTLKMYNILSVLSLFSAVFIFTAGIKRKYRRVPYGPLLMIVTLVIGLLAGVGVQKISVEPNEFQKEAEYLGYNIEYTQKAYGLNEISERTFEANQNISLKDILEEESTIENIRINDNRPARQTYNQLQGIRPYYVFNDVDVDRYYIDGKYTQVLLAGREISQERLRQEAKTWVNKYLKYTHGYGAVLSAVNKITSQGQPDLLIKNIPPVFTTDIKISRPEIYFGEMTNDYIITNAKTPEFDYPSGDDNMETFFEGDSGINLGFVNKMLFAAYNRSYKVLFSDDVTSESKIHINRNIVKRVVKIAPFFIYDKDPYLVIEGGKMFWIIDGFSHSKNFPYSLPTKGAFDKNKQVSYLKNSVKVVIDAYDGKTTFYLIDKTDPITNTYIEMFPDLFTDFSEMPQGIKQHIRYPQALFDIQADIYRDFHMNNEQVFYNREDSWGIAYEQYGENVQKIESNYVIYKLPEEEKEEFLLTVPYTPADKDNMVAFLVARNDGDNYGKLIVYKLPKDKLIYGPMQIESRISQDPQISSQITLWNQSGSQVIRGNLLIIPVKDSLIYVEPMYLQSSNENSVPELKRVIVAYEDDIVMKETLQEALDEIFGKAPVDTGEGTTEILDGGDYETAPGIKEMINKANELFERAQEAYGNGDWVNYGKYLEELEKILSELSD